MGHESLDTSKHRASPGQSLDITGPTIDRNAERLHHNEGREIEAKFFIPRELAQQLIKGQPFMQLEQRYFKSKSIRPLLERFVQRHGSPHGNRAGQPGTQPILAPEEFSSARIRRTRAPGQKPHYYLEFKGSKEGAADLRISRREITLTITSAEYKSLKEEASAGTIRKRRYTFPGTIVVNGQVVKANAQIDCLQAAGKKLRKVKADFDTVDIELHDTSHVHALRAGRHSFAFLHHCVEISALEGKLYKPLATRRIAKTGLEDDALKALKKLEAAAQHMSQRREN